MIEKLRDKTIERRRKQNSPPPTNHPTMITARPLGSRQAVAASTSFLKRSPPVNARPTIQCAATTARVTPPLTSVRCKSGPYGYTQAKSLVFSKFGEPSDVLKCVSLPIPPPYIPPVSGFRVGSCMTNAHTGLQDVTTYIDS